MVVSKWLVIEEVVVINLHSGGALVSYDDLRAVRTPEATATHVPIPHHEFVHLVRFALQFHGHEVVEEHYALDKDGARFFGLMVLKSPYGDYADTLGLRNSSDKSFPVGVAFGSSCFVCSNLAFYGDHVIKRRHTARLKFELPGLLSEIIAPLNQARLEQNQTFQRYQAHQLTDERADHIIMSMYRRGVIGVQRIADVEEQWQRPAHDWGGRTAWRIFNSTTYALSGRIAENPTLTTTLHDIIDGELAA